VQKAVVVIPTYNESRNIATVLDRVLSLESRIDAIVVDDASPDGTSRLVRACADATPDRIHLLLREGKYGLGTAYLEGFRLALDLGYDLVCEMDADLSHNPDDLVSLIDVVRNDEADLAIGSRYIDGVRVINWPLARLILSYGAGMYTRFISRMPIRDATSGYKCFHRRVLEAIDFRKVHSNGYSFQIEMSYRAWRLGFRLKEVPIVFTERTEGQSKMSKTIVREAALKVWELRLRSIFGRL
jgi:dolichol-phosphate mannosyltransferase